jgi:hypothetical protein
MSVVTGSPDFPLKVIRYSETQLHSVLIIQKRIEVYRETFAAVFHKGRVLRKLCRFATRSFVVFVFAVHLWRCIVHGKSGIQNSLNYKVHSELISINQRSEIRMDKDIPIKWDDPISHRWEGLEIVVSSGDCQWESFVNQAEVKDHYTQPDTILTRVLQLEFQIQYLRLRGLIENA